MIGLAAAACAGTTRGAGERPRPKPLPPYVAPVAPGEVERGPSAEPILIVHARIMTVAGPTIADGHLLFENGRIAAVGSGEPAAQPLRVIDARGWVATPGIIDTHSHLGVYAQPHIEAHADGNETSDPTTPEVWAEHGFWPQDPAIARALSGGVTTIQVLPGSANLIGGRSVVLKLRPSTQARAMRFPGAKPGLKMACGENPKRAYGRERHRAPVTRMGNIAGFRREFQKAFEYRRRWQKYERDLAAWTDRRGQKEKPGAAKADDPPDPPDRNFALETLADVLDGKILVHNHCYRADEMHQMLDLAHEFGFHIRSFHHALEAYKLAPRLAAAQVSVSTWADWWGFKAEAFDGIPYNAALLERAGARAIIHSDSDSDIRRLNQEAAKARAAGAELDLTISDERALAWITANPAWALGIERDVGTLEVGKMADVVLWDGDPLSVYTRARYVFIDGELVYDRDQGPRRSDFEVRP